MESILATVFREHHQHEAWWHMLKVTPKVASHSTKDAMLAPDEAPGDHCVSKLLGITMSDLWEVLLERGLARRKGKNNIIDRENIGEFITRNGLTNVLECAVKDKQVVLRIGVYSETSANSDHAAKTQWKSEKRPPRPLRNETKKFRDDLKKFLASKKLAEETLVPAAADSSPQQEHDTADSSPLPPSPPPHQNLKDFLSKILASQDMIDDPSFFKKDILPEMLESTFLKTRNETCDFERQKKKEK